MKSSVLNTKQVVSVKTGEILGKIHDYELDLERYQIDSICIRKKRSFLSSLFSLFVDDAEIVLDVERIVSVGADVILIDFYGSSKKYNKKNSL